MIECVITVCLLLVLQAYHAVSFSEDGFDVQGLNLPPYLPEQNYTPPGATPSQPATPGEGNPLSAATPPPHPYHQSALPYRPCDGPGAYSQHHGYSTDSLFPKFPPQSIDIPDITFSFPTTHSSSSAAPLLTCTGQLPSSVQDSTCTPTVTNYTNIQAVHPQPVHGFPHPGSILPPRSMSNHMLQVSTVDGSKLNLHTLRNRQLAMADNKPTSNTSSPVRESDDSSSDDSLPLAQVNSLFMNFNIGRCWFNVGRPSATLAQHSTSTVIISCNIHTLLKMKISFFLTSTANTFSLCWFNVGPASQTL